MERQGEPMLDLLTTLSHELRSPLTAIKGYTSTLLRHNKHITTMERIEFLRAIEDSSQRLELLIDHLLETTQLEAGTLAFHWSTFDLAQLISEVITALEQRFDDELYRERYDLTHRRQATIRSVIQSEASERELLLRGDRIRIAEMLSCLLENALLYSPQGGEITISARPFAALSSDDLASVRAQYDFDDISLYHLQQLLDQSAVEITVQDQGIGIAPEHLSRIFDGFYRVDRRLTSEINGLGLGLTISKQIVTRHNGVIWVVSAEGKGSTFHVLLPALVRWA